MDDFYELMFLQLNSSVWNSNTCQIEQVLHGYKLVALWYWFLNLYIFLSFFIPENAPSSVKFTAISVRRKWQSRC